VTVTGYTDSHAHLSMRGSFDQDRTAVLEEARSAGVVAVLDLATRLEEADDCIRLAGEHPEVHAAVGIHPHEASSWTPEVAASLRDKAAYSAVVALGEIGLDYHYNRSPPAEQRRAFADQLALAAELGLPVSVHSREAEEDTLRLLADSEVRTHGGVLHCFTGSEAMARTCLELGMLVSFSGILTFPKAGRLRDIASGVPPERLLVETDAPYLAPVPYRGRRNQPAYVVEVAKSLAKLKNVSTDELGRLTTENFQRLFLPQVS
jgi:TatD DNase family protein